MKPFVLSNKIINIIIAVTLPLLAYLFVRNPSSQNSLPPPRAKTEATSAPTPSEDPLLSSCTHWMFDIPNGSTWTYAVKTPSGQGTTLQLTKKGITKNSILFTYQDATRKEVMTKLSCGKYGLVGNLSLSFVRADVTLFPYDTTPTSFVTHSTGHLEVVSFGLDSFPLETNYETTQDENQRTILKGTSALADGQNGPSGTMREVIEKGKGLTELSVGINTGTGEGKIELAIRLVKFTRGRQSSNP